MPSDFLIEGIPYSRYPIRFWAEQQEGHDIVTLEYYDTVFFPNWKQIAGMMGGFPRYFTIGVDIASHSVLECYAANEYDAPTSHRSLPRALSGTRTLSVGHKIERLEKIG